MPSMCMRLAKCDPPDFKSPGAHINPDDMNEKDRRRGQPNLHDPESGKR